MDEEWDPYVVLLKFDRIQIALKWFITTIRGAWKNSSAPDQITWIACGATKAWKDNLIRSIDNANPLNFTRFHVDVVRYLNFAGALLIDLEINPSLIWSRDAPIRIIGWLDQNHRAKNLARG